MEASPPPPASTDRRSRPATRDDVRSLRRWMIVAGVWAVAATAIAAIALVVANRADDNDQNAQKATGQIDALQRDLNDRIDKLEQRIDDLPTSADLAKLDTRLKAVEDGATKTSSQLDRLSRRLDDVSSRVDALEKSAGSNTNTNTTTTP
jgi:septal ring factor EnvC (AmiA/AmiB activator)